MSGLRLSIRTRLALAYGGVFFAMGLCVIAISYAIVDRALSPAGTHDAVAAYVMGPAPGAPGPLGPGSVAPPPDAAGLKAMPAAPETGGGAPAGITGVQTLLTDVRTETLHSLLWTWSGVVALLAVFAGLLGWLLAARMLKPLRDITGAAQRLSEANLHERIGLRGPRDELHDLADTFDGMLGRLDAAFASQRRFVANASHELRTPLAVMRAQVDVALDDPEVSRRELLATSRVVRDAVDRCERLLDGLLVLARSDRGVEALESVDLADAVTRVTCQLSAAAAEHGVELRSRLHKAPVRGDHALLERMVANLLENAVSYNDSPGWVEVETTHLGGRAWVKVTNSGPRVPAEQVGSLFDPFRRLSGDRTGGDRTGGGRGAGLGLSIVRSVARAHGGEAAAVAREAGGLTVEVELPAA
jgi:signal transduction histidine kinase